MSAYIRSAVFVGAQFAASFIVIILISRSVSLEMRSGFFAAQAVILAVSTTFAQTLMMRYFQGIQTAVFAMVLGAFSITFALLWWAGGGSLFNAQEALLYAISAPLIITGSLGLAQLQYMQAPIFWPLCISLTRIATCAMALYFGASASLAFVLNAGAFSLGYVLRKADAAPQEKPAAPVIPMLFFFGLLGFSFQWDRLLLAMQNAPDLIVITGIMVFWALPPISVLFSMLTRANAGIVFAHSSVQQPEPFWKAVKVFSLCVSLYAGVLMLLWVPLNAFVFPFFTASRWLSLLLIAAIYLDRIGLLALYQGRVRPASAVLSKALPMGAAIVIAVIFEPGIWGLYALYLATSLIFVVSMWRRR